MDDEWGIWDNKPMTIGPYQVFVNNATKIWTELQIIPTLIKMIIRK